MDFLIGLFLKGLAILSGDFRHEKTPRTYAEMMGKSEGNYSDYPHTIAFWEHHHDNNSTDNFDDPFFHDCDDCDGPGEW